MNIHQRLAKVMEDVSYIQKDRKQGMNYTIVSHDKVTAKVRPALLKHGVIYYPVSLEHEQVGNRTQAHIVVRFANIEKPEDHIDVPSLGYGIDGQDKGPGKAISYAVKYALLKALGLETGDDPETESVDHGPDPEAAARDSPPVPLDVDKKAAQARAEAIIRQMDSCKSLEELHGLWGALWTEERAIADRKDVSEKKDKMKRALSGEADPAQLMAAG